jgi:hypothetical protein
VQGNINIDLQSGWWTETGSEKFRFGIGLSNPPSRITYNYTCKSTTRINYNYKITTTVGCNFNYKTTTTILTFVTTKLLPVLTIILFTRLLPELVQFCPVPLQCQNCSSYCDIPYLHQMFRKTSSYPHDLNLLTPVVTDLIQPLLNFVSFGVLDEQKSRLTSHETIRHWSSVNVYRSYITTCCLRLRSPKVPIPSTTLVTVGICKIVKTPCNQ